MTLGRRKGCVFSGKGMQVGFLFCCFGEGFFFRERGASLWEKRLRDFWYKGCEVGLFGGDMPPKLCYTDGTKKDGPTYKPG